MVCGAGAFSQNDIAELVIESQAKAGELLAAMPKSKGAAEAGTKRGKATASHDARASNLKDLGITWSASSRAQMIGTMTTEEERQKVAIVDAVLALEKRKAKERQKEHGKTAPGKKNTQEKFSGVSVEDGKAKSRAAKLASMSRHTYEKAKAIVEAAEEDPKRFPSTPLNRNLGCPRKGTPL